MAGTKADGLNVIMNNNRAAGQLVDHAHIHLVPRFEGDGFAHWKGKGTETKEDFEKALESIRKIISWQVSPTCNTSDGGGLAPYLAIAQDAPACAGSTAKPPPPPQDTYDSGLSPLARH